MGYPTIHLWKRPEKIIRGLPTSPVLKHQPGDDRCPCAQSDPFLQALQNGQRQAHLTCPMFDHFAIGGSLVYGRYHGRRPMVFYGSISIVGTVFWGALIYLELGAASHLIHSQI